MELLKGLVRDELQVILEVTEFTQYFNPIATIILLSFGRIILSIAINDMKLFTFAVSIDFHNFLDTTLNEYSVLTDRARHVCNHGKQQDACASSTNSKLISLDTSFCERRAAF